MGICFCDVFVSFFTGELHPNNGTLIPKPFVKRWVVPGLALQLLVNPNLAEVSAFVWRAWTSLLRVGVARALRWFLTVIFPVLEELWEVLIVCVWIPFVRTENRT